MASPIKPEQPVLCCKSKDLHANTGQTGGALQDWWMDGLHLDSYTELRIYLSSSHLSTLAAMSVRILDRWHTRPAIAGHRPRTRNDEDGRLHRCKRQDMRFGCVACFTLLHSPSSWAENAAYFHRFDSPQ